MGTKEKVYADTTDDLANLVADCQFSPEALFLAEKIPQHVITDPEERQNLLSFTHFDQRIPFDSYTSGRIFDADFELRWDRVDGTMVQVVYVGNERSTIPLPFVRDVERNEASTYYYLFGKRLQQDELDLIGKPATEGDFAEVRIPRLLRYPAPAGAVRVRLGVYEYVQADTGKVELFRFHSLEAAE